MSRIPQRSQIPRTQNASQAPATSGHNTNKIDVSAKGGAKGKLGVVIPSGPAAAGPSQLQRKVFRDSMGKLEASPGKKVIAVGATRSVSRLRAPIIRPTKRGDESLLQEVTLEQVVQRTPAGEYIGRTLRGSDVDPQGLLSQVELTSQQIDPTHGTESAGVNQTTTVSSTVSVTCGGTQTNKNIKRRTTKLASLIKKPNLNPHHINRLVDEEAEDVENALKFAAPELVSSSVEKFGLRKKLHDLRLTSEPISVLEQSVMHPTPSPDEPIEESPPETMFTIISGVEKGSTPEAAPNQVFNTLFPQLRDAKIPVSPVAPGPLEDIIVPVGHAKKLTPEALTSEFAEVLVECTVHENLPADDICTERNLQPQPRTPQGDRKLPMMLDREVPPWEDDTIQRMSVFVGGNPIYLLETSDEISASEFAKGVDYFVDGDTVPFETKVQLRGSKPPCWFPGYTAAFPHLPNVIELTRSPSGVLSTAWKAVRPKFFQMEHVIVNEPTLITQL